MRLNIYLNRTNQNIRSQSKPLVLRKTAWIPKSLKTRTLRITRGGKHLF